MRVASALNTAAAVLLALVVAATFAALAVTLALLWPLRLVSRRSARFYDALAVRATDVFCAWTFPFFHHYARCASRGGECRRGGECVTTALAPRHADCRRGVTIGA